MIDPKDQLDGMTPEEMNKWLFEKIKGYLVKLGFLKLAMRESGLDPTNAMDPACYGESDKTIAESVMERADPRETLKTTDVPGFEGVDMCAVLVTNGEAHKVPIEFGQAGTIVFRLPGEGVLFISTTSWAMLDLCNDALMKIQATQVDPEEVAENVPVVRSLLQATGMIPK